MYGLDEDYDGAEEGLYGTVKAIEKQTLRFLEIYKDFQIDNFNEWKEIDKTISSKIKLLAENVRQEQNIQTQTVQTNRKWWKLWKQK